MNLEVVICTHDPRSATLDRVVEALAHQTVSQGMFRVLLVDNASNPPVPDAVLAPLRQTGVEARTVTEPTPGLTRARLRALRETQGEWILFVDDDNELAGDYLEAGLRFAASHPKVGAFGGRLLLPPDLAAPAWVGPFLTYLGIRDEGDAAIAATSETWGPWEPAGAGLFVRREVVRAFAERVQADPRGLLLGRRGRRVLASCDDSFLVRQAPRLGFQTAYVPELRLLHRLDQDRFRYGYLLRLLAAFGESLTLLEVLVRGRVDVPRQYQGPRALLSLWHAFRIGRRQSLRFAAAMVLHHYRAWRTWSALSRANRGGPAQARP